MSKTIGLLVAAMVVAGGISAYRICRPKPPMYCINNLRAIDPVANAGLFEQNKRILAVLPEGTAFANAVSILGENYATITNADGSFYADFIYKLSSMTNTANITFLVESNTIVRAAYIRLRFPPHPSEVSTK
jgi:hypothetical protein